LEIVRYEFQDLRDLLYVAITSADLNVSTLFKINNFVVKVKIHDSELLEIFECKSDLDGNLIEFDVKTGEYKTVKSIDALPNRHYFIILKPKCVKLPGGITFGMENPGRADLKRDLQAV